MSAVLAFDIETVPDAQTGRRLHGLEGMADADTVRAMQHLRTQQRGSDFMPPHLQRVVAISVALRHKDSFRVWSLGEAEAPEAELLRRFFEGIEKYRPTLVSWNGGGFDLPVLHYRALLHGVEAPRYWDCGHFDRETRWDNYLGRYQFRHTDLMDVLALYNNRAFAPLDEVAQMLGLPGKLGMHGSEVWNAYQEGRLADIRRYCESDVLNTYLIYQRFQLIRGLLSREAYADEQARVRSFLAAAAEPHWREFLAAWTPA